LGPDVSLRADDGRTPLHALAGSDASVDERLQVLPLLVTHGADVSARDASGATALDIARRQGAKAAPLAELLQAYAASRAGALAERKN